MALLNRYQLDITGLVGGPGLMTFHKDPALETGTSQEFVDFITTFLNVCDLYLSTSISFTGFPYVEGFDSVDGEIQGHEPVAPSTVTGDNSTAVLPPVNQALIRWHTGVWTSGRELQGRTYMPGFCEDTNEAGGVFQDAVAGVIQTAANSLAANAGLVVWSRKHGTHEPVSDADVSRKWAYLSGRRD